MCLILCCKPLKAGRHGGQFLQTLWSDPLSPWHALSTCWQEESDRQERRTPFETPVRLQARLPSRVTMAKVFNSSVYVHGSPSCVRMCMPLITFRLSSFHVAVPWKPGHFKKAFGFWLLAPSVSGFWLVFAAFWSQNLLQFEANLHAHLAFGFGFT